MDSATKFCKATGCERYLNNYKEARSFLLGELEEAFTTIPPIIFETTSPDLEARLDALTAYLRQKFDASCRIRLEHDDWDPQDALTERAEGAKWDDDVRDEKIRQLEASHGILYDYIIVVRYNRYDDIGLSQLKDVQKLLSYWVQRDFSNTIVCDQKSRSEAVFEDTSDGDYEDVKIRVRVLPRETISSESVQGLCFSNWA